MTTKDKIIIIALVILFIPSVGLGEDGFSLDTGYDLYQYVKLAGNEKTDIDHLKTSYAQGYIFGFVDGLTTMELRTSFEIAMNPKSNEEIRKFADELPLILNLPDKISTYQVRLIYKKWAEEHPEQLNKRVYITLFQSLVDAYGWK